MATIKKEVLKGGCQMKVDRLVSIIMILLDKERIGAQELADMFEVSPRTIYRDIDTINMRGATLLMDTLVSPKAFLLTHPMKLIG